MSVLSASAGGFEVEAYTDGWPHRIIIHRGDQSIILSHEEVADLRFCVQRIMQKIAADKPGSSEKMYLK